MSACGLSFYEDALRYTLLLLLLGTTCTPKCAVYDVLFGRKIYIACNHVVKNDERYLQNDIPKDKASGKYSCT